VREEGPNLKRLNREGEGEKVSRAHRGGEGRPKVERDPKLELEPAERRSGVNERVS